MSTLFMLAALMAAMLSASVGTAQRTYPPATATATDSGAGGTPDGSNGGGPAG